MVVSGSESIYARAAFGPRGRFTLRFYMSSFLVLLTPLCFVNPTSESVEFRFKDVKEVWRYLDKVRTMCDDILYGVQVKEVDHGSMLDYGSMLNLWSAEDFLSEYAHG